jgi:hypothetical protein
MSNLIARVGVSGAILKILCSLKTRAGKSVFKFDKINFDESDFRVLLLLQLRG